MYYIINLSVCLSGIAGMKHFIAQSRQPARHRPQMQGCGGAMAETWTRVVVVVVVVEELAP